MTWFPTLQLRLVLQLLSVQGLFHLNVKLVSVSDSTLVSLVNTFLLRVLNRFIAWTKPPEVVMSLSTTFKNTQILSGETGGSGYLDGIPTTVQPVGCMIEFYVDENTPPSTWVLRDSTAATVAGATCRPTDYNGSTNAKVWFKTS